MLNKIFKKGLIIIVIISFIGFTFTPSIYGKLQREPTYDLFTKIQYLEGCGCDYGSTWEFPIVCSFLKFFFEIVLSFSPFPVPLICHIIIMIAEMFGCPNIP